MRIFKVPGQEEVKLTERDYKVLVKRFDVSSEKTSPIKRKCLCGFYNHDCKLCPLGRLHSPTGCVNILEDLGLETNYLILFARYISWDDYVDKEARAEIKAMHTFLLNLERS